LPKTYNEINEKIKKGDVVVVTAEEMIKIVEDKGITVVAEEIDVVTTSWKCCCRLLYRLHKNG